MTAVEPSRPSLPLTPPDRALIAKTVHTKLPFRAELVKLEPLLGDASNRRYFRLELHGGSSPTLILMQLAEPEAFKQSEEAVSGVVSAIQELPFVNILSHLAKADVPVPSLYYYDQTAGLLYLEDFGDLILTDACRHATRESVLGYYRRALDILIRIQTRATVPADPGCLAFHRRFDVPLLMWEFDHFLEYGVAARQGKPMPAGDLHLVRAEFQKIAELLAAQPRVFTHRDYHSRNLMVRNSGAHAHKLGVLDFQDALTGPATYDLASLLRDAYIALEEPLIDELLDYYLDAMAECGTVWADRAEFRRLFDLTSIQRNLKAAGRFVYIDRVKHAPKFLADIPRTLGYVRRNLAKYSELDSLRKHLAPYVPELQ